MRFQRREVHQVQERLVRGIVPMGAISYLEQHGDTAAREQVLSQLSQEWSEYPENVTRNGWYPLRHTVALYTAVARLKKDEQASYTELRSLGAHIGEESKTTFLRLLIRFLTPAIFARKFPEFWRKDHNFGTVGVDKSEFDQKKLRLQLSDVEGYDFIAPVCAGWIQTAFEAMAKNVSVKEIERSPSEYSAPSYCYEVTWE